MAQVELRNVNKAFGKTEVIRSVDLEINKGEFVVFVGPSGCGKSTLLRLIAGLESLSSGEIVIADRAVMDLPPSKRGIAMVFQSYALYPHMSVFHNMAFSLELQGVPKLEIRDRVEAAAKILQMEHLLDRRPAALSGGQRQRVAIGRAIVRNPDVFLFDEPLSNLDAALRHDTRVEIAKLHGQLDATTIYVTHDQVEAMTMGDRVAVIKDGVLQQVDTPQNLYDAPVNVFVAAFIGSPSMNLFAATLSVDGDSAVLTLGSQQLTLSDEVLKSRPVLREYAGKSLVVGIRPEDLEDAAEAPHISEGQRLTAPIKLIEALGSELMVHFSIDAPTVDSGDPDALDTQPVEGQANAVGRFSPRSQVKSGDTASVAVSTENLHFFDIETRLAIR